MKIFSAVKAMLFGCLVALGFAAQAAAIDVTAAVTDIAAQAAPISLIGSSVLLIFVAVKAFHWVRRALS